MEFQQETNYFKAHPLPFLVLKMFSWHYKSVSLRHRNLKGSFARWNSETNNPRGLFVEVSVGTQKFLQT